MHLERALAGLACVAVLSSPRAVAAEIGPADTWFVMPGPTVGLSRNDTEGLILGGELSLVHLDHGTWMGGYVDMARDFGLGAMRVSLGAEAGFSLVGLDAGALLEYADDHYTPGIRLRVLAGGGWMTLYVGPLLRFGSKDSLTAGAHRVSLEAGFLFKLPFDLSKGRPVWP